MKKGIIGIDVGGTNIKAAFIQGPKIIRRINLPTHARLGLNRSLGQIKSAIEPFSHKAAAVGIGIAGIIDSDNGIVNYSPNLKGWNNVRLAHILRQEFKVRVHILNDVNAICLGEWKYGVARGFDNVFLFTLGTGVGGAAICEGQLLFGANGFAGEFGHTTIDIKGPMCICGHRGHLERYVGAKYIVARARKKMKKKRSRLANHDVLTPETIALAAKQGDTVAKEVFLEVGHYIGIGIANILALFDPDIVVISGGIARAGRVLFDPVRKTTRETVLGARHRHYKIVAAELDDDAGILGAALYAQLTTK
jgi:glucokinase